MSEQDLIISGIYRPEGSLSAATQHSLAKGHDQVSAIGHMTKGNPLLLPPCMHPLLCSMQESAEGVRAPRGSAEEDPLTQTGNSLSTASNNKSAEFTLHATLSVTGSGSRHVTTKSG